MLSRSNITVLRTILIGVLSAPSWGAQDLPIETAPAASREVVNERLLEGVVEAINRSTVSAQTTGQVTEINYDVDDYVPKDSVLIRLRDSEQRAAVARAEAETERARARYTEAKKNLGRAEQLYTNKTISKANYDAARADEQSARAQLSASNAALEQAKQQLGYTVVRAPYSGVVVERHIETGETAKPGQPLMTGLSLEHLRVRVDVPQQLVYAIRVHNMARIIHPRPGHEPVAARKITLFPYASEGSNTFRARLELPPETDGLFPGMFVKTAFAIGKRTTLVVPDTAVVHRNEVKGVYVIKPDGAVRLRQVRPGYRTPDHMVEILAGLVEGERIAVDPFQAAAYLQESRAKAD